MPPSDVEMGNSSSSEWEARPKACSVSKGAMDQSLGKVVPFEAWVLKARPAPRNNEGRGALTYPGTLRGSVQLNTTRSPPRLAEDQ